MQATFASVKSLFVLAYIFHHAKIAFLISKFFDFRGFDIEDMVMAKGAKLVIPPFLAKKKLNRKSFTYEEAVVQRISTRGRVHIER